MGKEQSIITKIKEWSEAPLIAENRKLVQEVAPLLLFKINLEKFEDKGRVTPWQSLDYSHKDRTTTSVEPHGFLANQCELLIPRRTSIVVIFPYHETRHWISTNGPQEVFVAALSKDERRAKKLVCWPQVSRQKKDGSSFFVLGRRVSLNQSRERFLVSLEEAIAKEAETLQKKASQFSSRV
jgi:hypothetical protein